jgi:hypothetical protein
MLSTGLSTAFAALLGAFFGLALGIIGFNALKLWFRMQLKAIHARLDELESQQDAQHITLRKVAGRMGAAIAHKHPIAPDPQAPLSTEREHVPLGQVLKGNSR